MPWRSGGRRPAAGIASVGHARHVMATVQPINTATSSGNQALLWVGPDDRGVELEMVAVVLPYLYLVIHVMPTALRREQP